ncbi:hypothetical protein SASPL_121687 [Salvia splendens]|uniref:Multidrug resistance protein, MATE family n=1 Tax=Salvia splendens TaxID=180675 RepID=A0A8X8XWK0_SALSN|nr:hypothetical protein SASPL_121687 [Salvia splendens]
MTMFIKRIRCGPSFSRCCDKACTWTNQPMPPNSTSFHVGAASLGSNVAQLDIIFGIGYVASQLPLAGFSLATSVWITMLTLGADPALPGAGAGAGGGGGAVRVRADPADLRVRGQLRDTEVPAGAEHREPERVHIGGGAGGARRADVGGAFRVRVGPAGGVAGAELLVVGDRRGAVRVHREVLVLIAGLLPDPEIALASLAICGTLLGWVFMVSVGFNAAVSVRVSNELGAGHPRSAAFSVVVATGTSLLVAVVFAIVTFFLRHKISYAFTSGEVVSNAVADLTPILAGAIVLNGIQHVLSGKYF